MTTDREREHLLHHKPTDHILTSPSSPTLTTRWRSFESSQTFKLIIVATALFTDNFIYGVIVPTLPYDLTRRSGVAVGDVEFWTSALLASYGLASLFAAPIIGFVAERTSNRKRPLLLGLVLQVAATLVYGMFKDARALLTARLLQGLSAAIVYTSGLAFLVDSVGAESIGNYMGIALSAENVGLMISPLIGGPVYDKLGRNALVGLMLALIVIDIILRLLISEPTATPSRAGLDPEIAGVSPNGTSLPEPTIKAKSTWQLLKSPRTLSAAYGLFLGQLFLTTFDGVLPRFTQSNYSWSASAAGPVFLALSLPSLAAVVAGRLTDKVGPKIVTIVGFIIAVPGFVLLLLAEGPAKTNIFALCGALAVIGLAVAFITSPLASDLALVVESSAQRESSADGETSKTGDDGFAQVFSIMLFAQCAGIMLGPSWAGFAYKRLGWRFMSLSLGALGGSGIISSVSISIPKLLTVSADDL